MDEGSFIIWYYLTTNKSELLICSIMDTSLRCNLQWKKSWIIYRKKVDFKYLWSVSIKVMAVAAVMVGEGFPEISPLLSTEVKTFLLSRLRLGMAYIVLPRNYILTPLLRFVASSDSSYGDSYFPEHINFFEWRLKSLGEVSDKRQWFSCYAVTRIVCSYRQQTVCVIRLSLRNLNLELERWLMGKNFRRKSEDWNPCKNLSVVIQVPATSIIVGGRDKITRACRAPT